jgi:TET-Associated Glycosyltransferase
MFDNLQIMIPSRSRAYRQITIHNLPKSLWKITTIVVPQEQQSEYEKFVPEEIAILPFEEIGIYDKRNFILNNRPNGKVIMLDDDLNFYKRTEDGSRFYPLSNEQTGELIGAIVDYLDRYPMVGLTDKFMSQTKPRGHVECQRFNQILGFNRDLLSTPWCLMMKNTTYIYNYLHEAIRQLFLQSLLRLIELVLRVVVMIGVARIFLKKYMTHYSNSGPI